MAGDFNISRRYAIALMGVGLLAVGGFIWMELAIDRSPEPLRDREGWSNPSPADQQLSPDLPLDPRGNLAQPPPPPVEPKAVTPTSQGS